MRGLIKELEDIDKEASDYEIKVSSRAAAADRASSARPGGALVVFAFGSPLRI